MEMWGAGEGEEFNYGIGQIRTEDRAVDDRKRRERWDLQLSTEKLRLFTVLVETWEDQLMSRPATWNLPVHGPRSQG